MRPAWGRLLLAGALGCSGCARDPTELLLAVDSDIPDLGVVRVAAKAGGQAVADVHELVIGGSLSLPFSLAIAPPGGDASRDVVIDVWGLKAAGASPIVEREAITHFLKGAALLLPVFLSHACAALSAPCSSGQTCAGAGSCEDPHIDPTTLATVAPGEELRDAGQRPSVPDAGRPSDAAPADGEAPDARALDGSVVAPDAALPIACSPACPRSSICTPGGCQPLAPLPVPCYGVGLTALGDGRFFVINPCSGGEIQIYDPSANAWTRNAGMPYPHTSDDLKAALGPGETVYASNTPDLWSYSVRDHGPWVHLPSAPCGTDGGGLLGLDGLLYFFENDNPGGGVQAFEPATRQWRRRSPSCGTGTTTPSLPDLMHRHNRGAFGVLPGGRLVVAGGYLFRDAGQIAGCDDCAEAFMPGDPSWTELDPMPLSLHGSFGAAGAVGPDGRFYVFGGHSGYYGSYQDQIVAYDDRSHSWSVVGTMADPRAGLRVALGQGPDGRQYLYAIGGGMQQPPNPNFPPPVDTVEAYAFW